MHPALCPVCTRLRPTRPLSQGLAPRVPAVTPPWVCRLSAGAGGPVMREAIERVASALAGGQEGAVIRALQSSFLVRPCYNF